MNTTRQFATAAALCCSAVCQAAGSDYGSASAGYQAEMKREDPQLLNSDYIGDRASSQAKRVIGRATEQADSAAAQAAAEAAAAANAATSRGGRVSSVNIASPQIFGTVRGNVYVITQRSRGHVTSVER